MIEREKMVMIGKKVEIKEIKTTSRWTTKKAKENNIKM